MILVGIVSHGCGGDRIPSAELGWRCVCPEPECRRRQAGDWSGADMLAVATQEDRPDAVIPPIVRSLGQEASPDP
ncbi:hypothetical protein D7147_08610 [Micromonospora musae]|uniref:Uncharacterized protein n=1 Tax=Micromonospora musae TaxID=1894970 RepID=A0ABX9REC9_9ACTN|nr:hypothetical protein D7147_08610 [Micromonospora musae]